MNAIIAEHLTKEFSGNTAVKGISFQVKKGSIHGLLGPNGAGKSTTMNMVCQILKPSSGKVTLHFDNDNQSNSIGFLPELPPIYFDMVVEDYLKYAGKLMGLKGTQLDSSYEKVINDTGLLNVQKRLIQNLSKGYKQKVGLAASLIHNPEIIVLDEPTSGLDPEAISEIRELIRSLKGNHTIIFSSHQLSEVKMICDDVTIIDQGAVLYSGGLKELIEKQDEVKRIEIGFSEEQIEKAHLFLQKKYLNCEIKNNKVLFDLSEQGQLPLIVKSLVNEGFDLYSVLTHQMDLEVAFIKLIKKESRL